MQDAAMNPEHPLVDFAQKNASRLMSLIIWKAARVYPDLSVTITARDMAEFNRLFAQNGQMPVLAIIGKKEAVELRIVDEKTGRMLVVREGDPKSPNAVMMTRGNAARAAAPGIADRLEKAIDTTGSPRKQELLREAADALRMLTWEPNE